MAKPRTIGANQRPAGALGIRTLRLWLNAFIPPDLEETKPVTAGQHTGKAMLPTPGPVNAWFLTDNRHFSNDPDAHSRMHSEIELDMVAFRVLNELHRCHPTIELDEQTGEEICHEAADTSHMKFEDVQFDQASKSVSMKLTGSTKNPCLKVGPVKLTPNLDYSGTILIALHEDGQQASITFNGHVETYPAFEMYVSVNGGAPVTVFQLPVVSGKTAANLVGPAARPVDITTAVTA